ncbi:MAG: DUF4389 domain-containing protein [Gemmatimonadetes bacterium]|nr:DUF4389 domain-containing protein [Gemmatimonadota bacterium]MXY82825.1 DUF4389 domain-containing protein [Gemmatimonadota bacterium]MYB70573.1 DUF4389 domain-containing protein [Gemmatimonadota bacterium]
MSAPADSYPLRFDVDYPDRPLNRLTTFFRLFTVIPIFIVLATIDGGSSWSWNWPDSAAWYWDHWNYDDESPPFSTTIFGLIFIPALLMLLFRRKYPRWWFDWNLELLRFSSRVSTYFSLLRDEYPSTDEEQAVHLDIDYPDAQQDLNRWLPLIKWFLAIPHYIVLTLLGVVVLLCLIGAWFAILFTGHYPRALFDLVVGYGRWSLRVVAYTFILVTDQYPPFRLSN